MPRYFTIAEQNTWDSPVSGRSSQTFFDIASEDISPENNPLIYETAATRYPPGAGAGPYRSTGGVDTFIETENTNRIMKMAFGKEDVHVGAGGTGRHSHVYTPVSSMSNFRFFTSLINFDHPAGYRILKNAGIATMDIETTAGELVTLSFDVLGSETFSKGDAPVPDYSEIPFLASHHGTATINGTDESAKIEGWSVSIDNNLADDALVIGRRDLPAVRSQGLTVEGSLDISFDDWTFYEYFMGKKGANRPQSELSGMDLHLTATLPADSPGISKDHEFNIYIPNAKPDTTNANIDTRDRIIQSLDFVATHGKATVAGADYDGSIIVEIVNEYSGAY